MVSHPGAGGVRPLLKLLEVQALRGVADRDLLRRFAAARDEAAFRVIAERHGPMVFGVCARLLGNRHDAEDALQATFLVLARRAAAVRSSESLASWLHGVARRVAARLRRADRRRAARERAAAAPDAQAPADALGWAEARAGLDEELGRLPAAYREVLVLCYLEGLTRDEAGQRLGIEPGAVKGRLERGRRLLGERLVRRGIGLSAGLAGLAVAPPATAALRLARLAADPAAASPRAAALTHEFLKGVAMTKLKLLTAGLAGVLVLAVGVGTAQQPQPAAQQPSTVEFLSQKLGGKAPPAAPDTDEAFIRRVSLDLRGTEPSPAELHFFLSSKDANKRSVLVDLFVKERAAKGTAQLGEKDAQKLTRLMAERLDQQRALEALARELAKQPADSPTRVALEAERARLLRDAADRAAAERARAEAERAAALRDARLRAELEEQLGRAAEAQAQAERARAAAEAQLRGAAEAVQREKAKLSGTQKGFRVPNPDAPGPVPADGAKRPGTQKGFREVDDPNRPDPTPVDPTGRPAPKAPPAAVPPPPAPVAPPVGVRPPAPIVTSPNRNTVPAAPVPPPPAPAGPTNVEVLRVRVQLAEVTLREKTLHLENTENLVKNKVVSTRELDLAKLEVERARLQLREAQLTLDAAESAPRPSEPRAIPPSPARP